MSVPCQYACTAWASIADLPERCAAAAEADNEAANDALAAATDILFRMSGEKYPGICRQVVRPCGKSAAMRGTSVDSIPVLGSGTWSDRHWSGYCSCNWEIGQCGCSRLSEVSLGYVPVVNIVEVKVDGVVLDADRYRVDEWRYLVRLPDADGENPGWPCCQIMSRDTSEVGTWEVTLDYGSEPDRAGKRAAAALACQLMKVGTPGDCDLPPNVQNLARQGVSMNINSVVSLLEQGQTGVYEVDLWLRAINPKGVQRPAGVLIPGAKGSARRVET